MWGWKFWGVAGGKLFWERKFSGNEEKLFWGECRGGKLFWGGGIFGAENFMGEKILGAGNVRGKKSLGVGIFPRGNVCRSEKNFLGGERLIFRTKYFRGQEVFRRGKNFLREGGTTHLSTRGPL